jgi:hypothetical protein
MILEWLEHGLTPCPRPLRDMGYLREAIALRARWRRCRTAWGEHLARSRAVIEQAIAACPRRRTAMLLGAGLLLDVPVETLSRAFERVLLVDILPLPRVRREIARFDNVELVAGDATGVVDVLHARVRSRARPVALPAPGNPALYRVPELDLVVSANLLSQLPVQPIAWLDGIGIDRLGLTADEVVAFARAMIQAHLDDLAGLDCAVALIADIERRRVDRSGRIVERDDALIGVTLPWRAEPWVWRIAPAPELDRHDDWENLVVGIPSLRRAERIASSPV